MGAHSLLFFLLLFSNYMAMAIGCVLIGEWIIIRLGLGRASGVLVFRARVRVRVKREVRRPRRDSEKVSIECVDRVCQ